MANPGVYLFSQWLIGAKTARLRCMKEYTRFVPGQRVLDVGCGPGYVVDYFPGADYSGFDTDEGYIDYANRKYGHKGKFFCRELDDLAAQKLEPFDLIIMNGLLHHLNDVQATELFRRVKPLLKPKGELVTLDGCFVPGQSLIARKLLSGDRGKYVRTKDGYFQLAAQVFDSVITDIRNDMMLVPYTLIIMRIS